MRKCLEIGFCDSCYNHRLCGGHNYCELAKEKIGSLGQIVLIPGWCPLPDAPNPALHSDHEHPAVSNGKSEQEIQKGYSDYLRAHRGR